MDARWRLELLGGLRAQQDGRVVTRFATQRAAVLLGYLAYHHDRPHPREILIELLWPDCLPEVGRHRLSQALSSLRRQLEAPGVPTGGVIVAGRASVRLNPAAVTTDVAEFEAAVRRADQAGSAAERDQWLAVAVERYRGPLLRGYYSDWILSEQQRLAESLFQALGQLIARREEAGDLNRALQYAHQAVGADPLREEAHRELMRLYLASGQTEAALRQYQQLERLLRQELDVTPNAATRALVAEIHSRLLDSQADAAGSGSPRRRPGAPSRNANPPVTTGTATFLLTDIENSATLCERAGKAFTGALESHHALLRREFRRYGGHEEREQAGSFLVIFPRASDALSCAVAGQRLLADHRWPQETGPLRVRMALHTAEVELPGGSFHGQGLNRAKRILLAAHGGQILCSEVTAGLLRRDDCGIDGPGIQLANVGVYRLGDAGDRHSPGGSPEPLLQVCYPAMARRDFPPPNAEAAHSGSLPAQWTRFFGREEELARLKDRLQPVTGSVCAIVRPGRSDGTTSTRSDEERRAADWEHPRLVTLTGPGGSGKTRLGLEAARGLVETYGGAVWFVPLADLSDPRLIVDAVLAGLCLPRSSTTDPVEQVVEALSHRPTLLLLDNFEHLLEPARACDADTEHTERRRARENRGGLGQEDATAHDLPSIPRHPRPQHPSAENRSDGVALVRTLLERVPTLTCLVTSRQRLDLEGEREFVVPPLPTPGQSEPPEQLVSNASVQLFTDRAQAARPDFQVTRNNAGAVAQLCNHLEGIPLALELAAAWAQVLTPAQMVKHLTRRFEFLVSRRRDAGARHRTLRAAIDWSYRLLSPELQRFFARLSVFRGGWTLAAARAVCLPADEGLGRQDARADSDPQPRGPSAFDAVDQLARLRASSLILTEGDGLEVRFRMLEALREYGAEQLTSAEVEQLQQRHAEHVLALAEEAARHLEGPRQREWLDRLESDHDNLRAALAWSLTGAGDPQLGLRLAAALWQYWRIRGYATEGRRWLQDTLSRTCAAPPAMRARALLRAGSLACAQNDLAAARPSLLESLELSRQLDDRGGTALALANLGVVVHREGDYASARSLLEESLALFRQVADPGGRAFALKSLANVANDQGEFGSAGALYEESLTLVRELGDRHGIAHSLAGLGNVTCRRGEYALARLLYQESLTLARELGDRVGIAWSLNSLGDVATIQRDYQAARNLYQESLELLRQLANRWGVGYSLHNQAKVAYHQEDYQAARALYEQGLRVFQELGNKLGVVFSLTGLALVAFRQGLRTSAGCSDEEATGDRVQAECARAARLFGAAAALRESIGAPLPPSEQPAHEARLTALREALGEAAFIAAWEAGRMLTGEQAVVFALDKTGE